MPITRIITFWIKFWCKDKKEYHEIYEYCNTNLSLVEEDRNDTERWLGEAKCHSEDIYLGTEIDYTYGYEIVDMPPKEWLKDQLQEAIDNVEFYDFWLTMYNIKNE